MEDGLSNTQNKPQYLAQIKHSFTAKKAHTACSLIILDDAQVLISFEETYECKKVFEAYQTLEKTQKGRKALSLSNVPQESPKRTVFPK